MADNKIYQCGCGSDQFHVLVGMKIRCVKCKAVFKVTEWNKTTLVKQLNKNNN